MWVSLERSGDYFVIRRDGQELLQFGKAVFRQNRARDRGRAKVGDPQIEIGGVRVFPGLRVVVLPKGSGKGGIDLGIADRLSGDEALFHQLRP